MILALSGKMRSGKDTAADVLVNNHGFTKLSFAAPLKEICATAFDLDIDNFYNDDLKDSEFNVPITPTIEQVNSLCDEIIERGCPIHGADRVAVANVLLNQTFKTPRQLLQYIGTDVGRQVIDDYIWINITCNLAEKCETDVVIPDCRFENEVKAVSYMGGYVGLVKRPGLETDASAGAHASENGLSNEDIFDIIFSNDTTQPAFEENVDLWYSSVKRMENSKR